VPEHSGTDWSFAARAKDMLREIGDFGVEPCFSPLIVQATTGTGNVDRFWSR
jgi:hypothetical protein